MGWTGCMVAAPAGSVRSDRRRGPVGRMFDRLRRRRRRRASGSARERGRAAGVRLAERSTVSRADWRARSHHGRKARPKPISRSNRSTSPKSRGRRADVVFARQACRANHHRRAGWWGESNFSGIDPDHSFPGGETVRTRPTAGPPDCCSLTRRTARGRQPPPSATRPFRPFRRAVLLNGDGALGRPAARTR